MGIGRFACVAVPFALTVASLVCILIVMLAGITNKGLDMFEVKTQNLSISSSSLANIENEIFRRSAAPTDITTAAFDNSAPYVPSRGAHTTDLTMAAIENSYTPPATAGAHTTDLTMAALENSVAVAPVTSAHTTDLTTAALESAFSAPSDHGNFTAKDLQLADFYKVNLFGFCTQTGSTVNCTKAKFNWAASSLNTTEIALRATANTGVNVTLPSEVKGSLKTFIVVSKWTQVVYIIAVLTCLVELVFGLFAIFSRCGSCLTFLISGLSSTTILAASILATVQASVVDGAINGSARAFGLHASLNTGFLATTWLAAAFSIAGGLFWTFTICCCAADHHKSPRRSRNRDDREKLVPSAYQPYEAIRDPHNDRFSGQQQGVYNPQPQFGMPMANNPASRGNAYEPYAHTAV